MITQSSCRAHVCICVGVVLDGPDVGGVRRMTTRRHVGWAFAAILVGFTMAWPGKATATLNTESCLNGGTKVIVPGGIPGCWFLGDNNQSCTDVCASKGLAYDEKTQTVAGSDGSMENCVTLQEVFNVLGSGCASEVCRDGWGCSYDTDSTTALYCNSPATTADAANSDIERVCACMQGTRAPALSHIGLTSAGLLLLGSGVYLVRRRVTR
jgi:hypothetical protein